MLCYGNYVDIKKLSNCHSTLMVTSAMEITFTLHTHGDVRMRLLWKLLPHCRPMVTSPWSCNENYIKFSLFYKKNAIHMSIIQLLMSTGIAGVRLSVTQCGYYKYIYFFFWDTLFKKLPKVGDFLTKYCQNRCLRSSSSAEPPADFSADSHGRQSYLYWRF